ncbi:peptidase associated/transthyretin-like domain-containing protein, partial [Singulisphaera rosea]
MIASTAGQGLAEAILEPDEDRPEVTLRLVPEQVVRGRLLDLQGLAAGKVNLRVIEAWREKPEGWWLNLPQAPQGIPSELPGQATSDDQGYFTLRGFGTGLKFRMEVIDDRFARQELRVEDIEPGKDKEVALALAPAHWIEGTVTFEDTGKPAPGANLTIQVLNREHDMRREWYSAVTDADGRYRINTAQGKLYNIFTYPPSGVPYLFLSSQHTATDAVKQEVNLALHRGILVEGKITETPSGRPVAGAKVEYRPGRRSNPYYREDAVARFVSFEPNVTTGPDGTYRIAVLPGRGNLLVKGPTTDYLHAHI